MMSYVEKHLIPDETVLHLTRLSWTVYWRVLPALLIGIGFAAWGAYGGDAFNIEGSNPLYLLAGVSLLFALMFLLAAFIRRRSSEFAVTDKRIIIKVGILSRRSLEILLAKVEAITVDQSLWGRIFGYGTITIIGTGGTREPFDLISDPLEFRRQTQIAATS